MKFQVDSAYLLDCFRRLVNTPSPVGYYPLLNPVLEQEAASLGYSITYDNRGTPYIILEGQDNSKTVMVGAHVDTIGLVVRRVDSNGMLRVRNLGGVNFPSMEGETVTVHTRDCRQYTASSTVVVPFWTRRTQSTIRGSKSLSSISCCRRLWGTLSAMPCLMALFRVKISNTAVRPRYPVPKHWGQPLPR